MSGQISAGASLVLSVLFQNEKRTKANIQTKVNRNLGLLVSCIRFVVYIVCCSGAAGRSARTRVLHTLHSGASNPDPPDSSINPSFHTLAL